MDFFDISYLKRGNPVQQQAFRTLAELDIMTILADFHPVLAGTIPLDINLPGSDLDILCDFTGAEGFYNQVEKHFSSYSGFTIRNACFQDKKTVVASFKHGSFMFELFGQALPVTEQKGYRHLVTEYRLLEAAGPGARQAIRELKRAGQKTEPAFAGYFGISGDPYEQLYKMYDFSADRLKQVAEKAAFRSDTT